ncbi:MAG: HAMP domain-containing histidine kinase [Thermoleophilaceae bacterium]|nr:HAMP domain-containing histidine kinase [Thermoleophilaceae bacterium]
MTRLGISARFALLSAALVLAIAALVGVGGYLALRQSLLTRAQHEARDQARQLVALIDVGGEGDAGRRQANQVDVRDPSLTGGFTRGGVLVGILRPDGTRIQASPGASPLPGRMRASCLRAGHAQARTAQLALACARVGPARRPAALVAVGAPLRDARHALARLAQALALGVLAGTLLAAALARAVADRALRPARRIAQAASSIQSGDLTRRIDYQGPRDELGELADVLDACFAELEQGVERQRRFVADASHELRTPLATIQAHVELLRGWAHESPAARETALAALDQASRAAGRMGTDLLYLAQLDRLPPQRRAPAQLDQIVIDAVREAQPLRPEIPIRITRLDELRLTADELALRQLLVDLLANALRVSPASTEVTVELATDEHTATVTVSDHGPGIPPEALGRIFERFYTTAPRRSGSSGLGLAIAREIARRHGGDVRAANRPDRGAVFLVELPIQTALTESAPGSP